MSKTLYKPEYCKMIIKFFDRVPSTTKNVMTAKGLRPVTIPCKLPFLSAFARKIDVTADCLLQWTKMHKPFGVAYAHAKALQKEILIENALNGGYNPRFAEFTGKNIAGMRDKQELDVNMKTYDHISKQEKKYKGSKK